MNWAQQRGGQTDFLTHSHIGTAAHSAAESHVVSGKGTDRDSNGRPFGDGRTALVHPVDGLPWSMTRSRAPVVGRRLGVWRKVRTVVASAHLGAAAAEGIALGAPAEVAAHHDDAAGDPIAS